MNPATGQVWTVPDYLAAVGGVAATVRAGNPVPIGGNGLGDGPKYFSGPTSSRPILSYLDAAHAEIFLRSGQEPIGAWPSLSQWQKSVDMLADAGAIGTPVLAQTKVWVSATASQIDQWHRFALASFLLGADGSSWFTFSGSRTLAAATADHPWDRVDVGTPTGGYTPAGAAFVRTFTRGYAAVNPSSSSVNVTLPSGSYRNLEGTAVTATTLPPHSGEVFTLVSP